MRSTRFERFALSSLEKLSFCFAHIFLVTIATVAKDKKCLVHFKEVSDTDIPAKFQLLRINLS